MMYQSKLLIYLKFQLTWFIIMV